MIHSNLCFQDSPFPFPIDAENWQDDSNAFVKVSKLISQDLKAMSEFTKGLGPIRVSVSAYPDFCNNTVKPVLRDHCHERPPVLTDHTFLAEGPFQYN